MAEVLRSTPTPRVRIAQAAVTELAERQWGVVKRSQLEELGLSGGAISRWLDEGRLHRIHPRVFAVGHGYLSLPGRLAAALLYAGPGAALCGLTAASWLGIVDARPKLVHVQSPIRRRSLPAVRVRRRKRFERILHHGLPVTPPAQILLDIAASRLRFTHLRRALAEAEFLKLVALREVEVILGSGKPGSAALRTALELHNPRLARTRKGLEERFLLLCERYSLPMPGVNEWVTGWLADAVWFEHKVVVELDSHLAHGTPSRLERDHRRDLALRASGYVVLRYTWQQVTETPELVRADLARHGIRPTE
jgi:hypothetical protein